MGVDAQLPCTQRLHVRSAARATVRKSLTKTSLAPIRSMYVMQPLQPLQIEKHASHCGALGSLHSNVQAMRQPTPDIAEVRHELANLTSRRDFRTPADPCGPKPKPLNPRDSAPAAATQVCLCECSKPLSSFGAAQCSDHKRSQDLCAPTHELHVGGVLVAVADEQRPRRRRQHCHRHGELHREWLFL